MEENLRNLKMKFDQKGKLISCTFYGKEMEDGFEGILMKAVPLYAKIRWKSDYSEKIFKGFIKALNKEGDHELGRGIGRPRTEEEIQNIKKRIVVALTYAQKIADKFPGYKPYEIDKKRPEDYIV